MADVGSIVTDKEVLQIPSIKTIGDLETPLILGVEDAVQKHCNRIFAQATYTQERHEVSVERQYDNIVLARQNKIWVDNPPITDSGSNLVIEYETDTNDDGTPVATTVARSSYYADLSSGIITLRNVLTSAAVQPTSLVGVNTLLSFPEGEGRVLVTYQGGYATIPAAVKQAVLMEIARYSKMFEVQKFHETSIQTEFGSTFLLREGLSSESILFLRPYKRPSL
jgi:hypothetical protein